LLVHGANTLPYKLLFLGVSPTVNLLRHSEIGKVAVLWLAGSRFHTVSISNETRLDSALQGPWLILEKKDRAASWEWVYPLASYASRVDHRSSYSTVCKEI
jgi:hypothetical protein